MKEHTFEGSDAWPQAFDLCREVDRPTTAVINGERWKVFPSGHAARIKQQSREEP